MMRYQSHKFVGDSFKPAFATKREGLQHVELMNAIGAKPEMVRLTTHFRAVSTTVRLKSYAPTFSGTGPPAPENVCHDGGFLQRRRYSSSRLLATTN